MKDWISEGKKSHKINRESRAKEIARMLHFEDREITIYKESLHKQLKINNIDMQEGIEEF
jgi:hypothetical protein